MRTGGECHGSAGIYIAVTGFPVGTARTLMQKWIRLIASLLEGLQKRPTVFGAGTAAVVPGLQKI